MEEIRVQMAEDNKSEEDVDEFAQAVREVVAPSRSDAAHAQTGSP